MKHAGRWTIAGLAAVAILGGLLVQIGTDRTSLDRDVSLAPLDATDMPVVLELFTSQGCSSCPPADRLAYELAKDTSLLVITRPVTYWDRLGWTDTLAREENTQLQRAYATHGNQGAGVYTPQIVVNGRHGAVGSRADNIQALIRDELMKKRPKLEATRLEDGRTSISVQGLDKRGNELVLLALSSSNRVHIASGENGGRTIDYVNVVRDEVRLGRNLASGDRVEIEPRQMKATDADRFAVIIRQDHGGPVLAGTYVN